MLLRGFRGALRSARWVRLYIDLLAALSPPKIEPYQGIAGHTAGYG